MTKFSNKFKNPVFGPFWVHFPNFWGKKIFLENPALSGTTSYGFLAPCQNLKKLMIQFKENARTDGRKEGQTLFYRTLPATAGSPIKMIRSCNTI